MTQIDTVYNAIETLIKKRKKVFSTLDAQKRFGWEKWLQVELAFALQSEGDPEFEARYPYDHTMFKTLKKIGNEHGFIDLRFRKKNFQKKWVSAVELKVNKTERGLRGVLSDIIKIRAFVKSKWDFRSITVVLAHGESNKQDGKFKRLKNKLIANGAREILKPDLGFQFILIGWEESLVKNMTRDSFKAWAKEIEEIFNSEGIRAKKALS